MLPRIGPDNLALQALASAGGNHTCDQAGGHCNQNVVVVHAAPLVPALRRMQMMLAVVGHARAAMVRCQTFAAPIRRATTIVAVVVVVRARAVVTPVIVPVVAMLIATVRTTRVVVLRAAIAVVMLLRRSERCTGRQQRHNHEGSDDAFHLRTPASQEQPV
ncbi:hypothetical protein FHY16_002033 [Xanthomonas campestris]|nr:hypothetical protein [Xanthomonas euroxanthea]